MSVFSKIKEAFVKSEDKDKYLSGLDRSKKSFGDRMRALSNNFHGIDDDLLEQIMVILLESDVGIHTAQKIVDAFESNGKHVKEYDSMLDYLVSILYDFYDFPDVLCGFRYAALSDFQIFRLYLLHHDHHLDLCFCSGRIYISRCTG